jgi:hypothetical protein
MKEQGRRAGQSVHEGLHFSAHNRSRLGKSLLLANLIDDEKM